MRDMLCSGEKILDLLKIDYRFQAAEGSKYYGWAFRKRGQWIFTSIRQL